MWLLSVVMLDFPGQSDGLARFDIEFSVPMVHRLRFTEDCFGAEFSVVSDLIERSGSARTRVQVWMDDGLLTWDPELATKVEQQLAKLDRSVEQVGPVLRLPGGEDVKNEPQLVENVLSAVNRGNLDRRSYILVIGGGAVLDMVGYAAAIAHRGIRLIRFPTTTLAQADSGVGVKNAVNWFGKKNWKGTFATPWGVVNDQRLLQGLSDRDFCCGFSEAVKVALLKSPQLFAFLSANAARIAARELQPSCRAIRESVLLHLKHITRGGDPFEMLQARPLDFGHWSAHKLEALTEYGLRHGEAVSIGVAVDTVYSYLKLGLPQVVADETLDALERLHLPITDRALDESALFDGLEEFRQHLGGQLTITLIEQIGRPVDVHQIDRGAMRDAMFYVADRANRSRTDGNAASKIVSKS